MTTASATALFMLITPAGAQHAPAPLLDNERVTVWEVTAGDPTPPRTAGDAVHVSLSNPGQAVFARKGSSADAASLGGRVVVIDLKDARVAPLRNTSGYPNAFPRPGARKILENDRVVVWDCVWTPNVPTPMHFHDKDAVPVYVESGELKSTTPDGQITANSFTFATVRFGTRNRVHTEVLASGKARAIITEIK